MHSHRLALAVLLLSIALSGGFGLWVRVLTPQTTGRQPLGIVKLHVVDGEGRVLPANHPMSCILTDLVDVRRTESDDCFVMTEVPYGHYRLTVKPIGFETAQRYIEVREQNVWVVVSVEVGRIYDRRPPEVHGVVRPVPPRDSFVWFKLAGVLSDYVGEGRVDEKGRFSFSGISTSGPHVLVGVRRNPSDGRTEVFALTQIEVKMLEPTSVQIPWTPSR